MTAPAPARALLSGYSVREDWLALGDDEPVLEPELAIVDPHHHLWEREGERYLFPDLLSDMNCGHDVRASVFVQARAMYPADAPEEEKPLGEVAFVNGVAAQAATGFYGRKHACIGIVGAADLTLGDRLEGILERMRGIAGARFVGIRNSVAHHDSPHVRSSAVLPPAGLMADARFREGVRRLAAQRLTLDVWCYQTQLHEVAALAKACPGTTIVIDHVGGPLANGPYRGRRDEMFTPWRAGMAALAGLPNTRVKLGGLGMVVGGFTFHEQPRPPTGAELAAAWKPYIDTCITLFGPGRAMFETNFPVDKGMYGARAYWNACKLLSAGASVDEKRRLFAETAIDVYGLPRAVILG